MKIIVVKSLTVAYDGNVVLDNISFNVDYPQFFCIVGPNGAGKTTLLKAILGLVKPIKGEIFVLGINPLRRPMKVRRVIGYVPQKSYLNLDVPLLVKDIVMMGRVVKRRIGKFTNNDYEIARKALDEVGLLDLWNEPFKHLSGGQQQRVLLARALASEPRILILDEPFTGVDLISRSLIINILKEKVKEGITVVMVTHEISDVIHVADNVMLLNKRVLFVGKTHEVLNYYLKMNKEVMLFK